MFLIIEKFLKKHFQTVIDYIFGNVWQFNLQFINGHNLIMIVMPTMVNSFKTACLYVLCMSKNPVMTKLTIYWLAEHK